MSLLEIIWNFFRAPKPVLIQETDLITNIEMGQILKPYCQNIWLSDGEYRLMDAESLIEFLRINPVNSRKYITEFHDCDDYSYELMGDVSHWNPAGAFGMVWGNRAGDGVGHAWNFFVDEEKKLKFVEPQNDQIFNPTSEKIWIMII